MIPYLIICDHLWSYFMLPAAFVMPTFWVISFLLLCFFWFFFFFITLAKTCEQTKPCHYIRVTGFWNIEQTMIELWQTLIISTGSCYSMNYVNKWYLSMFMKLTVVLISKTIHNIYISFSKPGGTKGGFMFPFWNEKQFAELKNKATPNQPTAIINPAPFNSTVSLTIKIACRFSIHE